jgi:hypothetical protein
MNKSQEICSLFIILLMMMILSGCQKAAAVVNNTPSSQTSIPSSDNSSSSTTDTKTILDKIAAEPRIKVVPGQAGPAIRAAEVAIGKDGNVYYSSAVNDYKLSVLKITDVIDYKSNKKNTTIAAVRRIGDEAASEIILFNDMIYYTNKADGNRIYSINADGTNKLKLVDEPARNMIMIGNLIYYINAEDSLLVYNISNEKTASLDIKTRIFDSDGDSIYYEIKDSMMNNALGTIKIDGTKMTTLCEHAPTSISVQAGNAYYANGRDKNRIYNIASDGSKKRALNDFQSANLIYSNGVIYYINNSDSGRIYKIQSDGSGSTKVCDNIFVKSFIVDGNTIYFIVDADVYDTVYKISL